MKKTGIALSGIITGAVLFLLFHSYGCKTDYQNKETVQSEVVNIKDETKEKHSCCSEEMDAEEYSENSIYNIESEWTTQSGSNFRISDLRGKPVVLTMFFAGCTYACPVLVNDMKKIESKLSKKELKNYKFVLVSIDPEKDTPENLKSFAERNNMDLNRWILLTGENNNIQELAAVLGFNYKKDEKTGYSHSNLINILDAGGEIVYQHKGLNQDITLAAEKLIDQNNL